MKYILTSSADTDTPREMVYGDTPIVYGTQQAARDAATALNSEAEREGYRWTYGYRGTLPHDPAS